MAFPLHDSDLNIPEGLKEYVQHQIQEMGYRNLTETELDKYTLEFAKLIVEKPSEDMSLLMSSLSEHSCASDDTHNQFSLNSTESDTPTFLKQPAHVAELRLSPIRDPSRPQSSHSALYKEILSEADNTSGTVQDISVASLTDISILDTSLITKAQLKLQSKSRGVVSPSSIPVTTNKAYKRKIANQKNQEKDTDYIPSDKLRPTTAPNISHISGHSLAEQSEPDDGSLIDKSMKDRGKSFIRPNDSALSSYRIHKHDPVSRYHEFSRGWQQRKAPGEKNRNQLRWVIREQLNYQSIPGNDSF
ncbi:Hydrolethalus syndrome protein 1-like [Oopsacas minuta]|uniref:Hydrolethalus syndrome protein 1-like n=1 Tax=Oopsacas minuta TaxID=111878 RepID=A0AAV7JPZ9_9METZ|nr:Hydrolethalus syndrome protein 1-like [Oopsacas minuta]